MVKGSGFASGGAVYGDGKIEVYGAGSKYEFGVVSSYLSKTVYALRNVGIHIES